MARRTSFYYAFLTLPPAKRRAIFAVFDFCRAVDDGVDLESDPVRARLAVEGWRAELDRIFRNEPPHTSEGRQLQPHAVAFRLTRANFDALVDGVEMDIEPRRYATFADLEAYCHRVASAVGLMCVEIFGYRNPSVLAYARDLGVALQMTNILRDVAADYRQGRVYIPQQDLERFGVSEADLGQEVEHPGRGVRNSAVRGVLEQQGARARVFFARAVRELPADEKRNLVAAEAMREIYAGLLQRIEQADYDVFSTRIRVPGLTRVVIAARTWWRLGRAASAG